MTSPTSQAARARAKKPPTRASRTTGKDYAAIARERITSPSQIEARLPTFLIYARNKKGKTRFTMSAGKGKVLILDPEHGTDEFKTADPHVWHIDKWEDLDDVYKYLRSGDHPYRYVGVDGLTRYSSMALRFVMSQAEETDINRKPGMVQQRDYGKAGELMKSFMYNLHNLPIGVIYTAQERQVEGSFSEEDEDVEEATVQYVPDLPKGVRATVNSLVDVIGRLYIVKVEKDDDTHVQQRRLWLEPSVTYDTGYRSDFTLPEYLVNPTVPKLIKLIREGVTK